MWMATEKGVGISASTATNCKKDEMLFTSVCWRWLWICYQGILLQAIQYNWKRQLFDPFRCKWTVCFTRSRDMWYFVLRLALEVRVIWISLSQELEKVRREVLGLGEEPLGLNTLTSSTGFLSRQSSLKRRFDISFPSISVSIPGSRFIVSILQAKIQACAASDSTWPIFPGVDMYVCFPVFFSSFILEVFGYFFFIVCFCAFCLSLALSVALESWIFKRRRSTRDFSKCWKLGCAEC